MKVGLIILGVIVVLFSNCTKQNISNSSLNESFTWVYGNTSYKADSGIAYSSGMSDRPIIVGRDKGSGLGVYKIALTVTSFNVGKYILTPTGVSKNNLYYSDDNGNELLCLNGEVEIISNSNGHISGTFTANLTGTNNVTNSIKGSFTDTPITP
jgi:hypothetical protein